MEFTCKKCGVAFFAPASQKRLFCSRACWNDHRRRENHPLWKGGGRRKGNEGYMRVVIYPENPHYEMGRRHSDISRDVLEHRLIMAQHLGRDLLPNETVHHRNGDRQDNRIENLELWIGRHGRGTNRAHCATCTCFDH